MPIVSLDIEKFNQYASACVQGLEARGDISQDLLDNLFKDYEVVSDKKFVEYIKQKVMEYFVGEDITPDSLMRLVKNKYASRVRRGVWGGKPDKQKQIIA